MLWTRRWNLSSAAEGPISVLATTGKGSARIASRHFQELQWMLGHYAACLSDSMSELSCAAFGLTTQNLGR